MQRHTLHASIASGLGALMLSAAASAAHIDFVDSDDFSLTEFASFDGVANQSNVAGTPGGSWSRVTILSNTSGGDASLDNLVSFVLSTPIASADQFSQGAEYSSDAQSTGLVQLLYSNFLADFLNIPFADSDWARIDASFFGPSSPLEVTAGLFDADGTFSAVSHTLGPDADEAVASFAYSDFLANARLGSTAGLDLTQIVEFNLTIDAAVGGTQFALTDIRRAGQVSANPVPVAGTLPLLTLGVLGFLGLRRKTT